MLGYLLGKGGRIKLELSISCMEGRTTSGILIVVPKSSTLPIYDPALDYPLFLSGGFIMPLDGMIGESLPVSKF